MQCFMIVLMFSTPLVHISLQAEQTGVGGIGTNGCRFCPAGEFQKSCTNCEPCPAGSYTTKLNQEDTCHHCYRDCRPDFHLKVVQNCSSTSDLKCICDDGFRCSDLVPLSTNCRYCVRVKGTPSFPKTNNHLAAILCPLAALGFLALVTVLFLCCHKEESCFKQAVSKLRNKGGGNAAQKPKEPTHQFTRDSFSAKQQPSSVSANLGPVHVHNPGTVIVSLLNQFTGQVGPTIEGVKPAEREQSRDEDERNCPVSHPTSSPSIHLSEEEKSAEIDSMFLPSQEQGKDYHVSKEEVL